MSRVTRSAQLVSPVVCALACVMWTACAPPQGAVRTAGPAHATRGPAAAPATLPARAPSSALRGVEYRFSADAALTRLSAELCLHGAAPSHLMYGSKSSAAFVRDPKVVSEAGAKLSVPRTLRVVDAKIELGATQPDACIEYAIDLRAAQASPHSLVAAPCERGVVTSTELFLWRPPVRPAGMTARARFELPAGVGVSVPWREEDGAYTLDETAFSFTGHALFGQFQQQDIALPSATLSVATAPGFSEAQRGYIATWLANAGNVVSLATGRFPVSYAQVIVLPTAGFSFGHTGRSGGASILFFVPSEVVLADLRADWIAVHEFSHLLHPFVEREDAWLSEGIATYLQEVLRVRAGMLSARDAWRRMFDGAARGRGAPGNLSSETRRMAHAPNYETVYWAGAAIALMADVELRARSQGRASLDTALAGLSQQDGLMQRSANADSLLAALDASVGGSTFREVAQRYLEGRELPDLAELYQKLGLLDAGARAVGSSASSRDLAPKPRADAPLAWVADAIMAVTRERAAIPFGG